MLLEINLHTILLLDGGFIDQQPIYSQSLYGFIELVEIHGFDHIGICAQPVGPYDVLFFL